MISFHSMHSRLMYDFVRKVPLPNMKSNLNHWRQVTHICVSKLIIVGSDNGLSSGRRQAIIWAKAGMLSVGTLGTNFSEILIEIHTFSFRKMHLKLSSARWRRYSVCNHYFLFSWYWKNGITNGTDEIGLVTTTLDHLLPWASYQIRKIAGCTCAWNAGNVFSATDFKDNRNLAIPACITARASRMSGSLTRGGEENVPGFPGACAIRNFTYLTRSQWGNGQQGTCYHVLIKELWISSYYWGLYMRKFSHWIKIDEVWNIIFTVIFMILKHQYCFNLHTIIDNEQFGRKYICANSYMSFVSINQYVDIQLWF